MLDNYFFNIYAVPPMITTFVVISIITKMLKNWSKRTDAVKYFVYLCCFIVIWLFSFSMMYFSSNTAHAFFWARLGFLGVTFVPVSALAFVYILVGKNIKKSTYYFSAFAAICLILNWTTDLIYSGVQFNFFGYYPTAGKLYIVFLLMYVIMFSICSIVLFKSAFNYSLPPLQRRQILYVFMAFTIALLAVVDYITKYDSVNIYPFGYAVTIVFLSLMSFAIVRYNLLDIELFLTKSVLYVLSYSILFGIPVLFGARTGHWEVATFIAVIFASLGTIVFSHIQKRAENIMLAEQRSYQNILLQAATSMTQRYDLQKLLNMVVHLVKRFVKVEFVSIYLQDAGTKEYKIAFSRHNKKNTAFNKNMSFSEISPFVSYIKSKKIPFVYEEIPYLIKKEIDLDLRIGLIVPAFTSKSVNGFMLLGEKENRKPYSVDDIKIFNILATQTVMAIENCMFMEDFKKAQEKVFAAEKLASIGGLAEGVAHQVNNRLNHFSMIAGEMRYELDEFKNKIMPIVNDQDLFSESIKYFYNLSDVLTDNVKRTSSIVTGILNYAKVEATETNYKEFELREVIELSINLLKIKHNVKSEVLFDYSQVGNKAVFSVKSLVMESVYNLMDNSYEAILEMKDYISRNDKGAQYAPKITITLNDSPNSNEVEIIVADNGIGIKPEHFKKMFAPFFTTKSSYKSGSGIGMYIVKRMIEEMLKGRVYMESEYLQGTNVHINLPKNPS